MAGQIHREIQKLITEGGKSDPMTISFIRTKLILKGVDPDKWNATSDDSPEILAIIERFSQALLGRRERK
jgi:hypothetical protein